jgi:hypothetical protein
MGLDAMTRRTRQAWAARGLVERALDVIGWRWLRRLSLWIDALVILEEDAA